jgi:hypothetical protein
MLIHTQEAADARRSLDVSDSNGVFATFVNGKVGFGTQIPSYPLEVQDTSQNLARFETTKNTDEGVEVQLYKNRATPADNDQLGYLQFSGNDSSGNQTIYNAIIGYSRDVTDGTEDGELRYYSRKNAAFTQSWTMYGDSGDFKIHNGNLVFGTSGTGIDFSATSGSGTSELLDDYEEGTFTPKLGGATNYSSYHIDGTGTYVKVGRLCYVNLKFTNQDINNSAAGAAIIYNLPYGISYNGGTSRPIASSMMSYNVAYPHSGDRNTYCWYGSQDTDIMYGMRSNDAAGWTDWDVSNFHSGTLYYDLAFSYFTD